MMFIIGFNITHKLLMSGKYTAYSLTVQSRTSAGLGAPASKNVFTREESK